MPTIVYVPRRFNKATQIVVDQARVICEEYAGQGFTLTLRQLYYQFVARGYIPNTSQSYDRLGSIVNDARLAGELDWNYLQDRGRNLQANSHWTGPDSIIRGAASGYAIDKWAGQSYRPEVWIEKEALIGVIEGPCAARDVAYIACKGYFSQSEMWSAAYYRFRNYARQGQTPIVLHFGDHDPSGIDMTRDIGARLGLFLSKHGFDPVEVRRLALNMDQVDQYNPPPNPAKVTDSRFEGYREQFGDESWELDALNPPVIAALINEELDLLIDRDEYREKERQEAKEKKLLTAASEHWRDLVNYLEDNGYVPEDEEEDEENGDEAD